MPGKGRERRERRGEGEKSKITPVRQFLPTPLVWRSTYGRPTCNARVSFVYFRDYLRHYMSRMSFTTDESFEDTSDNDDDSDDYPHDDYDDVVSVDDVDDDDDDGTDAASADDCDDDDDDDKRL